MVRTIAKHALSDQLREVIASRGTAYAVAKSADVDPGIIQRFLTGERGLTVATLDRLAEALGLRLVETGRRPAKSATRRKAMTRRPTSTKGV